MFEAISRTQQRSVAVTIVTVDIGATHYERFDHMGVVVDYRQSYKSNPASATTTLCHKNETRVILKILYSYYSIAVKFST